MRVETDGGKTKIVAASPVVTRHRDVLLGHGGARHRPVVHAGVPERAGAIQTGIIGLVVGVVAGFVPARAVLEIDRAAGSLRGTTRGLFQRS